MNISFSKTRFHWRNRCTYSTGAFRQPFLWHEPRRRFKQVPFYISLNGITDYPIRASNPLISNVRARSRGVLVRTVGVECARQSYSFLQSIHISRPSLQGAPQFSVCYFLLISPPEACFLCLFPFTSILSHVSHWIDRYESASWTQYSSHIHVAVGVGVPEWEHTVPWSRDG